MEFEIKDIFTFCACIVTIIGAWFGLNYKIKKIEETTAGMYAVMFLEKGGLNLIDRNTCAGNREQVQKNISSVKNEVNEAREETRRAFDELSILNQNLIKIMMHMQIEPVIYKRKK